MDLKNEEALLSLLKKRDYRAFTQIYNRYWRELFIQAFKIVKDQQEASDIIQDVFTNVWNKIEALDIQQLQPYLFACVRHHSLKVISKSKKKDNFIKELMLLSNTNPEPEPEEQLHFKKIHHIMEQQIALLPEKMRAIYLKGKVEGLPYSQIAEDLGISENSVKTTIYRAMIHLRRKLSPYLSMTLFF